MEMREVIDQYIGISRSMGTISDATAHNRRYELKRFAAYCRKHGVQNVERISRNLVREYLRSRKVSNLSRRTMMAILTAFFNFCVDESLIPENPTENIPLPKAHRPEPDALTEEETQRFFQAVVETSRPCNVDRNLALAGLLCVLCLRVSEALSIKLSDLDLPENPNAENWGTVRLLRKGGKEMILPLSEDIYELLRRWLDQRPECGTDHVFVSLHGKRMSARQAYTIVARALRHAGIVKRSMGPHLLRHTGASQLIADGMDIRTMQHLLGHSSLVTTSRYVHWIGNMRSIRLAIERRKIETERKEARKRT